MSDRKDIYEWAVEYCGDPASHVTRGSMIFSFLREYGLMPEHRVLDLGCGALSQGVPLIKFLQCGRYVGLDPNGWLIEAALQHDSSVLSQDPTFVFRSDFDAIEQGPFDFVVAHSVLSHVAHWQMEMALRNVRKATKPGGVWLASLRLDQYDLFAHEWRYPDVSYFRMQTVQALAFFAGWNAVHKPELRDRLREVAPNDVHDWVVFTAIPTTEEMNDARLDLEQRHKEEEEIRRLAASEYERRLKESVALAEIEMIERQRV